MNIKHIQIFTHDNSGIRKFYNNNNVVFLYLYYGIGMSNPWRFSIWYAMQSFLRGHLSFDICVSHSFVGLLLYSVPGKKKIKKIDTRWNSSFDTCNLRQQPQLINLERKTQALIPFKECILKFPDLCSVYL